MKTLALPSQQQEVCYDLGAVPLCLSQWGSGWAPATGLSHVQHLCLCVLPTQLRAPPSVWAAVGSGW